jgi:hypothetical protein
MAQTDSANLDQDFCGLVVFTAKLTADGDFEDYNTATDCVCGSWQRPDAPT